MSKCPDIRYIQFDKESIRGIEYIRRETQRLNIAHYIASISSLVLIFFRNEPLGQAWNISQFDWVTFRKATQSIGVIKRRRIMGEAIMQQDRVLTYNERAFWEAVANGCE